MGTRGLGANERAMLWIDRAPQDLSDVQSSASCVYVSGDNTYIAGTVGAGVSERATLWINGESWTLGSGQSRAFSVFVR